MSYAHMSPIFGELAGFNIDIFGLSSLNVVDPPPGAQPLTQIWIRHATLLPKKEKYLSMSGAPAPRPGDVEARDGAAERDDVDPETRNNFIRLADDALRNFKYRGARPLVVTSAQSIKAKDPYLTNRL